jgi:hypothetical protein
MIDGSFTDTELLHEAGGGAAPAIDDGGMGTIVGCSIACRCRAWSEITQLGAGRPRGRGDGRFKCAMRRRRLAAAAIHPPTIVFILPSSFAVRPGSRRAMRSRPRS